MDKEKAVREFRDAQDLTLRLYARQGRAETLTDKARAYVASLDKRVATVMLAGALALGVHLNYRDRAQAPPDAPPTLTAEQVVGADVDDGILNQEEPAPVPAASDGFVRVTPSQKLIQKLSDRKTGGHHRPAAKGPSKCSGPSPK